MLCIHTWIEVFGASVALTLNQCTYSPLDEQYLRLQPPEGSNSRLKATYLGNTTIHITDGTTNLLVDGFLSRPPWYKLFLGHYHSDPKKIEEQLENAGIDDVDVVLVGHTHGDHALDAPYYAKHKGSTIMGSRSYSIIHRASGASEHLLHEVTETRNTLTKGEFKITFVKSAHIEATGYNKLLEGSVSPTFRLPAHFTKYNCGETYAIHIAHPNGNIAVTTSAGSKLGQWGNLKADVLFLGIGLLSKFPEATTKTYWQQTVDPLSPRLVVATHWDNFSKKLIDKGINLITGNIVVKLPSHIKT